MGNRQLRRTLKNTLTGLLGDATSPDSYVSAGALEAAGIPRPAADEISRRSRSVHSHAEAVEVAGDYADSIADYVDEQEAAVRDGSILDRIPRQ